MKKVNSSWYFRVLICLVFLLPLFSLSCSNNLAEPDPEFVSGVSAGILGRWDSVIVEFHRAQDSSAVPAANAFTLSPGVRGSLSWQNEFTLAFTPSEPLRANQLYTVRVNLPDIPSFSFEFMSAPHTFGVNIDPVRIAQDDRIIVSGLVTVDIDADSSRITDTVSSRELGRPVWTHEGNLHRFTFNLERGVVSRTAEITWNGRAIGSDITGFTTVVIPGADNFELLSIWENDGIIEASFSSNIRTNTDLRGFVSLAGSTDIRYSLDGNIIRIFGEGSIAPGTELSIQDLEDESGRRLITPVQFIVPDRWELPQIRFPNSGAILPTSQGSELIIETRNVSGIIVEAFHIYEDNMIQFLQVNSMTGVNQLDRVGEPVWIGTFDFTWLASDQNRWVRRGLDLSELIRRFPGGMYRLRISFRQRHVQYECEAGHGDFSNLLFPDDDFPPYAYTGNAGFWDDYWSSPGYNWSQWYQMRNDPCHPAFFHNNFNNTTTLNRNILISDLGLQARRANDGSWLIGTTNLISARPSPNTMFSVYSYQGRLIYQGRTGSDGLARIAPDAASAIDIAAEMGPASRLFIYAENSLGRAYLRVNDSISLAVSHFDIAGGQPVSGIRGLIYGERGVWRPGDDIFLSFILSDPEHTLPSNHPVIFEFLDPMGRLVVSRTYTDSVDGFYPMAVSTANDAPTGDWLARVRVGGRTFTRNIKVEAVMPNRLGMNLYFGPGDIISSTTKSITLEANWLFGAPGSNLRSDINVSFYDMETVFPGYQGFSFRDPSRTVSSESGNLWEGNLDAGGRAEFAMTLNPGANVPGRVRASFITRVFENSGAFSNEQVSLIYSPYERYVGIRVPLREASRDMIYLDTDNTAEIVLLNEDGSLYQGNVNLNAGIYRLSWRWWWEMGRGEAAEIASILSRTAVSRTAIIANNGRAEWNFRTHGMESGRYLLIVQDINGGHAAAQIVNIGRPGWTGPQDGVFGTMLTLSPGRDAYNAGERAEISFPSNREAYALITIEKGGEIIRTEWISCEDEITRFEFVTEPSMVPNVYVHVSLFQPHLQTQNDLPIRLYGIVPVFVNDPRTVINPVIAAPSNWEAESTVFFTVSERNGRPMVYTVAVVDEGLLGLTRFTLPNPGNTFYAREASFIRTWDLYNDIIGAYSGRLETLLAIGGGEDIPLDTVKETQRFPPVVRYFGPFELAPNESRTETFDLPPYIGAVRIMVMAASSSNEAQILPSQRAYGTAEASVRVTSDLMVFATLPRVLSPGDEVDVPVFVNSHTEGSRNVRVSLAVNGGEIIGSSAESISFERAGESLTTFRVRASDNPGNMEFSAIAESAGLRTARQVTNLDIRSTAVPVTTSVYTFIQPGEVWEGNLAFPGREGTNSLTMEITRLPPINLESRLDFLIRYPHGCLEQVTSGVFPQLYLDMVTELNSERLSEIRRNVSAGIERLYSYQTATGGFAYWLGESIPHDWGSSYAGHFLLEARRMGYPVRESVMKDWIHYQRDRAAVWQVRNTSFSYHEQAYRLYTLALAGEADMGSMNRLRSFWNNMPIPAMWNLAAAYWYAGQRDIARNMVRDLELPSGDYRELSQTFGSTLRDKAMILETLILMGGDRSGQGFTDAEVNRTRLLFEEIADTLSQPYWLSTQETAFALVAIAPFVRNNSGTGQLNLEYEILGIGDSVSFTGPGIERSFNNLTGTSTNYRIRNNSSIPFYAKLVSHGLPDEGSEPYLSEGLELRVEYRDPMGRIIQPDNLRPGEDMEVRITVRNTHGIPVEEIALVVPVPASWEILNTRLAEPAPGTTLPQTGTAQAGTSQTGFRYQDIRDDRVMTYFNLDRGGEITISFMVNFTYRGNFFRPAIHAYAMYDESIRALLPGSTDR